MCLPYIMASFGLVYYLAEIIIYWFFYYFPGCRNRNHQCEKYERYGFCNGRYASWMSRNCKKSCNKCQITKTSGKFFLCLRINLHSHEEFLLWIWDRNNKENVFQDKLSEDKKKCYLSFIQLKYKDFEDDFYPKENYYWQLVLSFGFSSFSYLSLYAWGWKWTSWKIWRQIY